MFAVSSDVSGSDSAVSCIKCAHYATRNSQLATCNLLVSSLRLQPVRGQLQSKNKMMTWAGHRNLRPQGIYGLDRGRHNTHTCSACVIEAAAEAATATAVGKSNDKKRVYSLAYSLRVLAYSYYKYRNSSANK